MVNLQVKDIGLVAYMQMNGCVLLKYNEKVFELESDESKTSEDWAVEYSNSCCSVHDQGILALRNLVRSSRDKDALSG